MTDTTDAAVQPWSRLSPRVIWVDLVLTALSLSPMLIALALAEDGAADIAWPLVGIAVFGVIGAVSDAMRWIFSSYRVTGSHVELRSGVFFRRHRSLRRERIRSVDTEAKLRHRLSGMRMVQIGAGQQAAAGESAFTLDALAAADARALQSDLLSPTTAGDAPTTDGPDTAAEPSAPRRVFATFSPRWMNYNIVNGWAYLMALGLVGGTWGLLSSLGVDLYGWISDLYDWESLGWQRIALTILAATTVVGVLGLAVNYVTEYWKFELARVPGPEGTQLRTRQGLFTTREVNRDENRIRGVQLNEPLFWRWMGVTDTHIITTGLDVNAMSDPAAILPRTHRTVARRVAADVLGEPESLYDTPPAPPSGHRPAPQVVVGHTDHPCRGCRARQRGGFRRPGTDMDVHRGRRLAADTQRRGAGLPRTGARRRGAVPGHPCRTVQPRHLCTAPGRREHRRGKGIVLPAPSRTAHGVGDDGRRIRPVHHPGRGRPDLHLARRPCGTGNPRRVHR